MHFIMQLLSLRLLLVPSYLKTNFEQCVHFFSTMQLQVLILKCFLQGRNNAIEANLSVQDTGI